MVLTGWHSCEEPPVARPDTRAEAQRLRNVAVGDLGPRNIRPGIQGPETRCASLQGALERQEQVFQRMLGGVDMAALPCVRRRAARSGVDTPVARPVHGRPKRVHRPPLDSPRAAASHLRPGWADAGERRRAGRSFGVPSETGWCASTPGPSSRSDNVSVRRVRSLARHHLACPKTGNSPGQNGGSSPAAAGFGRAVTGLAAGRAAPQMWSTTMLKRSRSSGPVWPTSKLSRTSKIR